MGLDTNVFHYNAAATACEKGAWELALTLLSDMSEAQVGKDIITYHAAISAFELGGKADVALELINEMKGSGIPKESINERLVTGWHGP